MSVTSQTSIPAALASEDGMTLIEVLVATVAAIVVILALFAILEFSVKQEARITERVQANRGGRTAMTNIVDELHSSCVGFGTYAIQAPSTKPTSPLAELGPADLWMISAYGSSSSNKAVIEKVYEHDIHWSSTGKSKTGETVGTLTDYRFESTAGSGPASKSGKWEFPALETKNAKARVLATNVIPMTISGTSTIFQYFKFTTATSGELTQITENIPSAATKNEVVKVGINFTATSESGNTSKGYGMAPFSDAVVLRLQPTEVGSEVTNEPCT
jgi:Tfp pilus assembly protein PilW